MEKNTFVNPYNFFPLEKNPPVREEGKKGTYTGVIEYSLLTKTPLFIPNSSNEDAFCTGVKDHKSYDFFSYDDLSDKKESLEDEYREPVIPGSEIRGMLRSYYEILTNSCLSALDDDEVLSKRTQEVFKPGLIRRSQSGEFLLHKAEDCIMRAKEENSLRLYDIGETPDFNIKSYKQKELKEGERVYAIIENRILERGEAKPIVCEISKIKSDIDYTDIGYVIKGEPGPQNEDKGKEKHNCHIFVPYENKMIRKLSKSEMSTLGKVLDIYNNNAKSGSKKDDTKDDTSEGKNENTGYQEYKAAWENFEKGNGEDYFPVYYSEAVDEYIMLAPAAYTREIYKKRLSEIVGLHDSEKCNSEDGFCPTCALFGKLGITSRVRVSDARLKNIPGNMQEVYKNIITLEPLSGPKINNVEFYLKHPEDAWFWTYDYYIDYRGKVHEYTPEINGRKFYWHQPNVKLQEVEKTQLNTTVRPLRKGVFFSGKVYFNHLSEEELNTLIYAINAGDDNPLTEKTHCYKLGHGKPLGMGSVAISVDLVEIRKIYQNPNSGEVKYEYTPYEATAPILKKNIVDGFNKMTDFNLLKNKNISYPKLSKANKDGEYPIYEWFTENHGGYDRKRDKVIDMPNQRNQMYLKEYMYSLEPELRETLGVPSKQQSNSGKSSQKTYANKRSPNTSVGAPVKKVVTVESVDEYGNIHFCDDGLKGTINAQYLGGRNFNVGDQIKVKCNKIVNGKNGEPLGLYSLVK